MKKIMPISFTLILIFLNLSLYGQNIPCYPEYPGLFYTVQTNQSHPPFSTDMPLDLFIGYLSMDSLSKSVNLNEFHDFLWRQTYNDTVQTMMRYLYKTIEYDPSRFFNFERRASTVGFFISDFIEFIKNNSPYPVLDASLLSSYFIGSVTVSSVYNYTDNSAAFAKTASLIRAQVDSLVKGEAPLNCTNDLTTNVGNQINNKCIEFEIAQEWFDADSNTFSVLPGQKYFIFGDYRLICSIDSTNYFTILPLGTAGSRIYPIIDNNLIDTNNELGFGTSTNINIFYNNINNRINEIKNYQP